MITLIELLERTINMHFCDVCRVTATYHVANPGSNVQTFCDEHFPKFLKVTMPFVTLLTQVSDVFRFEETPVVEEPVVETPAPKVRKKAAAVVPEEEPVTE
jgi:hypothetical protein